jgi:hypothetical protein
VVAVSLTGSLGSLGVAYGRVAFFLVPMLAVFDLERRFLGGTRYAFWFRYTSRLALASAAAYIIEIGIQHAMPASWITLISAIVFGMVAYGLVLLAAGYLTREDRQLIGRIIA